MPKLARTTLGADTPALLTTKELADYLRLNERTVLKLAGDGEIPGIRLGNQWRFKRAVVDAWLDDEMLGLRAEATPPPPGLLETFTLADCFGEHHVIPELQGQTMPRVLEELASLAAKLGLIRDKTWFLGALLERENVLPSGVGEGVAFPHTLGRHPEHVRQPFLLFGRKAQGISFGAADGQPVRLIIVMGLRYEQLHLPWLAKLSRILRDADVRKALLKGKEGRAIAEALTRACAS